MDIALIPICLNKEDAELDKYKQTVQLYTLHQYEHTHNTNIIII